MHPLQQHLNALSTHWASDQPRNMDQLAALSTLMEQLPRNVQELLWNTKSIDGVTLRDRMKGQQQTIANDAAAWNGAINKARGYSPADRLAQFMSPH